MWVPLMLRDSHVLVQGALLKHRAGKVDSLSVLPLWPDSSHQIACIHPLRNQHDLHYCQVGWLRGDSWEHQVYGELRIAGAELFSLPQQIWPPQFLNLQPLPVSSLPLAKWHLTIRYIQWMHLFQCKYATSSLNQGSNPIWKINPDLCSPCRMCWIKVGLSFLLPDLIDDCSFQILALLGLSLHYLHLWTSNLSPCVPFCGSCSISCLSLTSCDPWQNFSPEIMILQPLRYVSFFSNPLHINRN